MKKMLALCCLTLCLLLGSCGTYGGQEGPAYHAPAALKAMQGYNAQNKYMRFNDVNFQETEDFFCGTTTLGDYAHYYDKASGISGVLCADPACTHDSPDCGAQISQRGSLACHEGKRYWIAEDGQSFTLCRSDLGGTNREQLKTLDWDKIILTYQPQRFVIHQGRLYILGRANSVEGTGAGLRMTLLSMSLDESPEVVTLYDQNLDLATETTARFVGDSVYFSVFSYSQGSPRSISITKFDTEDGSAETVYEETGITGSLDSIWVTDQGEIYLPGSQDDRVCLWKLEDGKRKEILCWEGEDYSIPKAFDDIFYAIYLRNGVRCIDVADLSGKTIYSGEMFPEGLPGVEIDLDKCSYIPVGGDAEKLILNISTTSSSRSSYTVLLDLRNNLKPTILWSSEG